MASATNSAVHVREASFCRERDEEPLPPFLVWSHPAKPMLPQSLGMPPSANLVERSRVGEDDECIKAAGCGEVDAQPTLEAVIVYHLALMRLRVVGDPRGLISGIRVRCLKVLTIDEACGLLVTAG